MHFPFTPNHVQLISDCYPPQAALWNSAPQYRPNAQELSRLVYYATNKAGKITKLSAELEKRVKAECRKAQAGNTRYRAYVVSQMLRVDHSRVYEI
jgi:protein EFR3